MRENYLEDFYSFLRFPSISTDDKYAERVAECAHWLVKRLTSIGLETQLVPTRGHPIVWARNKHQSGRRTVLIYGHYDVQPPDPLELWDSPPFEPVLKNGYVFARGATDNKGQILSHILGIQETIEQNGDLPVNLHLVIEGEEEIGSAHLGGFLQENRDALKSDVAVVSDTGMIERGVPTLSYGLRGVTALEIKITGPKMDLHSGVFGGAVQNPITALAQLLGAFAGLALLLAAIGTYGVVSYMVAERRREIGIRLALGAEPYAIRRMVVREGLTMAAIGCLLGIVGAQLGAGLLSKFMYETRASDPVTLVTVIGAVIAVALVACAVPGWRASGEDPTQALRAE